VAKDPLSVTGNSAAKDSLDQVHIQQSFITVVKKQKFNKA
jgi:hypothetical protein